MKLYTVYLTVLLINITIQTTKSQSQNKFQTISYTKYQSLFNTEASKSEYNYNNLDSSKTAWHAQVKFNWELIHSSPYKNKLHPFILCYRNEEKTSRQRHEHITKQIRNKDKVSLLPYSIMESETCYQLYSTLKQSQEISKKVDVSILPLSSAMKMFSGSVETIEQLVNTQEKKGTSLVTIDSILCPGIKSNKSELRKNIKNQILKLANNTTKINSKLFWSTYDHQSKQGEMWQDILKTNDQCASLYESMHFEFDEIDFYTSKKKSTIMSKVSMVVSNDATDDLDEEMTRLCLLRLMLSTTQLTSVCSLQVRPEYKALNQYGQWLVQAGIEDTTPWYDVGLNGTGQVVAHSDTGIDMDHCYFRDDNMTSPYIFGGPDTLDLSRRKIVQYDDYMDNDDYDHGHGSHVAGTIAGCKSDNTGTSKGIAPNAKIAFLDLSPGNTGLLFVPDYRRLLMTGSPYAKIHSMSWGSLYNGYGYYAWQFDTYLQEDDELLLVIAAGNSGDGNNDYSVGDPSTLKNGIAVGSAHSYSTDLTNTMRGPGYISYFSSRGPTLDGRTKPDILAPGHYISSAAAGESCDGRNPAEPDQKTRGLISYAGTSMATPITAASAALVRQYLAEGYYPSGKPNPDDAITTPSASLIKAILLNGGQDMFGVDNGLQGVFPVKPYDNIQNMGRISLVDSVYLENKSNVQVAIWDRESIEEGVTLSYSKTIDMSGGCNNTIFSAMLVWADPPPAQPYCNNCNVNDLDLTVTKNNGDIYYPNGYTGPDRKNNAERVRIIDMYDGDVLEISVTAHTVFNVQNFSLVASGCFGGSGNDVGGDSVYQSEVRQGVDGFEVLTGVVQ